MHALLQGLLKTSSPCRCVLPCIAAYALKQQVTDGRVWCCAQAGSKTGDLNSSVNKRLELGLVVFVTINTLLQTTSAAQPGSVLSFPGFWATAAILGLTVTAAWGG